MLPLAHMGITVTLAQVIENRLKSRVVDYRLLLVASLLPDIIDKPIGYLIFGGSLFSSKIYGHTLLFLLFLGIVGLVSWNRGRNIAPLILFAGTFAHDILDVMWRHPETFLWPLYGWTFVTPVHEAWGGVIQIATFFIPKLVILEIVGGFLVMRFLIIIARTNGLHSFLKNGKISLASTENKSVY